MVFGRTLALCLFIVLPFLAPLPTLAQTLINDITSISSSYVPKAAYGVRNLSSTYSGPLLRIRQGTHGAIADVWSDVNGSISSTSSVTIISAGSSGYSVNQTLSLNAFKASANLFVSTWYDQSGNGKHVTQSTNSAQPQLVLSGAINSRGAISFTSSNNQFLSFSGAIIPPQTTARYTLNAVWNTGSISNIGVVCEQNMNSKTTSRRASLLKVNSTFGFNGESNDANSLASVAVNENIVTSVVMDNSITLNNVTVFKNANPAISGSTSGLHSSLNSIGNEVFIIGKKGSENGEYWQGNIAEVIIFDMAINANTQPVLMGNQGNYFRIPVTQPLAPTSVTTPNITATSATLSWIPPANDGGSNVSDYIIEYRPSGGTWLTYSDGVSVSTTSTVNGLTPGVSYEFRISAINSVGTSPASGTISATTTNTYIISPSKFFTPTGQAITINITPVNAFTGVITLQYSGAGTSGTQTLTFNSAAAQSFSITPTTSGTITVIPIAQPSFLEAPSGALVTVSSYSPPLTILSIAPAAAFGLRLLNNNYTAALIKTRLNNSGIEANIYPDSTGKVSARSIAVITAIGTSSFKLNQTVYFENLLPSNTPYVTKWYDQSGNNKDVLQTSTSNQPTLLLTGGMNNQPALSFLSSNQQFLSYNGAIIPTQSTAKYTLNAVFKSTSISDAGVVCEQNMTSLTDNKRASLLRVGAGYGFNGQANDAHSLASVSVNENIITSVVMNNANANNITLYKNANALVSGSTSGIHTNLNNIGNEVFTVGKKGSNNSEYWEGTIAEIIILDNDGNTTTQRSLISNQGTYFRVLTSTPDPPTNLSSTSLSTTSTSLIWTAPSTDGGGNITDYLIEYRTGSNAWQPFADGVSTNTYATITGLSSGLSYDFRISSVNLQGTGLPSLTYSVVMQNTCILSAASVWYETGQPVTITVTPTTTINGSVTIQYSGAGLSGNHTLSFNSNTPQSFTITPNVKGTVNITAAAYPNTITPPDPLFITIANPNIPLTGVNQSPAAYGVRLQKTDYSGALAQLRLSNGMEVNIYPDSNGNISVRSVAVITNIGTSAYNVGQSIILQTLLQGNTLFVKTWYDQSGNNRHVIQTDTNAQPQLNISATPAYIDFSNTNTYLQSTVSASFLNNPYTITAIVQARLAQGEFSCWTGTNATSTNTGLHWGWRNGTTITVAHYNNDADFTATYSQNTIQQYSVIKTASSGCSLYQNGALIGSNTSAPSSTLSTSAALNIGRGLDMHSAFGGYIYEMLFFNQELTAGNRQTIECNQTNYLVTPQTSSISSKPINTCGLISGNLGGNIPMSGYSGLWSKVSGPGNVTFSDATSYASTATATQSGSYVFRWTLTKTSCSTTTFDEVTVNFNTISTITLNNSTLSGMINDTIKLGYTSTNATHYNITWNASALYAGFTNINDQPIANSGNINILIPSTAVVGATYTASITPQNNVTNCTGTSATLTINIQYAVFKNTNMLIACAYGLRKLNNLYAGNAVRVKRSSDNTAQNIGFTTTGDLDTAALKNFVGNGNGTITTWYDQSGRNKHVSATSGREPIIVSGGLIIRQNGRPALQFNGGQGLSIAEGVLNGGQKTYTMNAVASTTGSAVASLVEQNGPVGNSNKRAAILQYNATDFGFNGELNDAAMKLPASPSNTFTTTFLCNHNNTTGNIQIFLNGKANLLTTNSPSTLNVGTSVFVIGYKPSTTISEYWTGHIQEVIFSPEVISAANRIELQNSQSSYYLTPDSTQIIWTGSNSNSANTSANWSNTAVPSSSTNIFIPNNSTNPIVISNTLNVKSITIANNASVTISSSGLLKVADAIISNGKPIINNGTIEMNGSTPQLISGNAFDSTFKNLTINNTNGVNINGPLQLNGILTLTNGTLNTNGQLILRSSASSTASIATIPATADIIGNVTFQRYIPSVVRRSRMVSSPIQNFTWQQLNDDIYISGTGGAANGFDVTPTNSSTCYTYEENPALGRGWKAATNITQSVLPGTGMLVFIRGDRSLAAPQWYTPGLYPNQNEVTLDFENAPINKGTITPSISYNFTSSITSDGLNLIGNPYPSAVSWDSLFAKSQNISRSYYLYNPTTGSYEAKTSGNIAAGQSFFIQAIGNNPIFTFTEDCKVNVHNNTYFKTSSLPFTIQLSKDSLNSDFVSFDFSSTNRRGFYFSEDALKATNAVVNLHTFADTLPVQINAYPLRGCDTFALWLDAPNGNYTITAANFEQIPSGYEAWLIDHFENNKQQLTSATVFRFTINNNPQSKGNRFSLVISTSGQLPVKWMSFEGITHESDINLKWVTAQEYKCSHFEIERSFSNRESFQTIGSVKAKGNTLPQTYIFSDLNVVKQHATDVFYRIKQVDEDANFSYSNIIHLTNAQDELCDIQVMPNPASASQTINIVIPRLYGDEHQLVLADITGNQICSFHLSGDSGSYNLTKLNLKPGVYYLSITSGNTRKHVKLIIK